MLTKYLHRLYDTINSRGDLKIEVLSYKKYSNRRGSIKGRIKFYNDSILEFSEQVVLRRGVIEKLRYTYHYQTKAEQLIFRYDNAPHHPHIVTHPHHKHVGPNIESALPPDLNDVLSKIDKIIYARD